jgi:hypothetical protein
MPPKAVPLTPARPGCAVALMTVAADAPILAARTVTAIWQLLDAALAGYLKADLTSHATLTW